MIATILIVVQSLLFRQLIEVSVNLLFHTYKPEPTELDVLRVFLKTTLLCFIACTLFSFTPLTADAGDNVHRKATNNAIVAEIFVTSW
jgi:predicted secreted protein